MPKKITTAVIEEQALVALLTAAMEVYKKETFGLLIGSIRKTRYKAELIIKNALSYQKAVRKEAEVSISPSQEAKIRPIINELSGCKIIGDFHSHTRCKDHLSRWDMKDMIEDGERFSLLVVVKPAKQRGKWYYDKKSKSLHGTLTNNYHITIKVYAREFDSKVIRKLRIECPYIEFLNNSYEKKD